MTDDSIMYNEYSKKVELLNLKVIDDIANAEILKHLSDQDKLYIIKKSELKIEKVSQEEILEYESKYRIKIPSFVKFLMTEIGLSNLVCFWFFNEGKIEVPSFYFSYDFFNLCLQNGLTSDYLNDFEFDEFYDNDTNSFKDSRIQQIYKELNFDDELHIIKLLPTGHGDCSGYECLILNEINNGLVVWTGSWREKIHLVDGVNHIQYDYGGEETHIEEYCMDFLDNRLNSINSMKELLNKQTIIWRLFNRY